MEIAQKFLNFYKQTIKLRPCIGGRTLEIGDEDNFNIHLYENVLKNTYNLLFFLEIQLTFIRKI